MMWIFVCLLNVLIGPIYVSSEKKYLKVPDPVDRITNDASSRKECKFVNTMLNPELQRTRLLLI
jgi:hypothetical protein